MNLLVRSERTCPKWVCSKVKSTLKKEIFSRIDFRELVLTKEFAGINFCELGFTEDFAWINFRESALYKHFAGVNLTFTLRNIFSLTLIYGFENNLSNNQYFFNERNDKITDHLEKTPIFAFY